MSSTRARNCSSVGVFFRFSVTLRYLILSMGLSAMTRSSTACSKNLRRVVTLWLIDEESSAASKVLSHALMWVGVIALSFTGAPFGHCLMSCSMWRARAVRVDSAPVWRGKNRARCWARVRFAVFGSMLSKEFRSSRNFRLANLRSEVPRLCRTCLP